MEISNRISALQSSDENSQSKKKSRPPLSDETLPDYLTTAISEANKLSNLLDDYTVNVQHKNEDSFFRTSNGTSTVVTRYDLEKTIPLNKKPHFIEIDRYWVNKPFAFVILFRSTKENEVKYYAVEPHLNPEEQKLLNFLKQKIKDTIKYSDEAKKSGHTTRERAARVEEEAYKILLRYNLLEDTPFERPVADLSANGESDESVSYFTSIKNIFKSDTTDETNDEETAEYTPERNTNSNVASVVDQFDAHDIQIEQEEEDSIEEPDFIYTPPEDLPILDDSETRPVKAVLRDTVDTITDYQAVKLTYYLKRDSVMYGLIDPIKHDLQVEDISCDGYNSRVWVYHEEHEQIITNIEHGKKELDNYVINLAQRAGQGISKRNPQVDITLPDGSRGQLTLGDEVSDHGTNYTIRQFKDVPFTPIDLINWKTFAPEQMAFLWLAIENHKSMIFAGGTASGKTTSLNAVSLFIPSNTKIVSIEDTREVELPQRNWVASVTRPSFSEDGSGEVDEFSLLEAALRQRPDYIVMGEIRGEEGRTLFQVMSTGHTTYTTFHADSVSEVIKRFTTDPINVSKTLFTALDLVSIQTQTRVDGNKVRRNKALTEVNEYNSETDEISVNDIFQWIADTDTFEQTKNSQILEEIKFDRGWDDQELSKELRKRQIILAYLIQKRLNTYTQVAATIQAFINDPEIVLDLIANDILEESLQNLRDMESVTIDIDTEKESLVPRPEPTEKTLDWAQTVLKEESTDILANRRKIQSPQAIGDILASPTDGKPRNEEHDEPRNENIDVGDSTTSSGFVVEEPEVSSQQESSPPMDEQTDNQPAAELTDDNQQQINPSGDIDDEGFATTSEDPLQNTENSNPTEEDSMEEDEEGTEIFDGSEPAWTTENDEKQKQSSTESDFNETGFSFGDTSIDEYTSDEDEDGGSNDGN